MDIDEIPFIEVNTVGGSLFTDMEEIGKGGQATVYRAKELGDTQRTVAVKLVSCHPQELRRGNPSLLDLFKHEITTWKKFEGSLYVVNLRGTFRHKLVPSAGEACFLGFVMEYSELGDLSKKLSKRDNFWRTRRYTYWFLQRIAQAIKEGHLNDVTHGDIKPQNILLFRNDGAITPKLMDFGMGISANMDFRKYGGTPSYLAPERFGEGFAYARTDSILENKQSDIYSLGILFFEILSGRTPYQVDPNLTKEERWAKYGQLHAAGAIDYAPIASHADSALTELIRQMLQPTPSARPAIVEVIRKLERILQDSRSYRGRMTDCPIASRTYRWNPEVHRILRSQLYFYFIKGRLPDNNPTLLRNLLEEKGLHFYSFHRVLGGFDYVLQIWVKAGDAEQIDLLMESYKLKYKGQVMRFRVIFPDLPPKVSRLDFRDEDSLLSNIESCGDRADQVHEQKRLMERHLISGKLKDYAKNSIQFFLVITVTGETNDATLRMYSEEIKIHLMRSTKARDVNVYRGVGDCQLLAKFRLLRFQEFRKLYEVFIMACDSTCVTGSTINSQTFVELDECGVVESDDGSIVGDLVRRQADNDDVFQGI